VVNPLPASVLREAGIRFVVGSNVAGQDFVVDSSTRPRVPNLLQIVSRIIGAMERELLKAQVPLVDVLVRPRVLTTNSLDFSRVTEFIAEGERAARRDLAGVLPTAEAMAPTV
jgi:predicted acylesterase/phospholipase RssA